MTREQIEETRGRILDDIAAAAQEFNCTSEDDERSTKTKKMVNELCDLALKAIEHTEEKINGNDSSSN